MIKAIVYTSCTGYTAEYAKLLADKTGIPLCSVDEAKSALRKDDGVIFLGWLMAGSVTGLKAAMKLFAVKAVCAVGLCETGSITDKVREQNKIAEDIPVFTLQGGYAPEKLRGMNKFMMKIVTKALVKKIDKSESKTESDYRMRKVLTVGGSCVSADNLDAVVAYLHNIAL